jgi:hypothetical protein
MGSLVEDLSLPDDGLVGLSDEEIQLVTRDQELDHLPARYVEFLRVMGRSAGRLLAGTDVFYPDILGLRRDALELLSENGVAGLIQDGSVVFAMHQGYQVYWMNGAADDPPVLMYHEGDSAIRREWDSFTDFLRYESSRLS